MIKAAPNTKHQWPTDIKYRRYQINYAHAPWDIKRQLEHFLRWISAELRNLQPQVIATERLEVRLPEGSLNRYGMPEVTHRWFVCIEVDEFSIPPPEVETRWQTLLRTLLRKPLPSVITPQRVLHYYSLSDRQYAMFQNLFDCAP